MTDGSLVREMPGHAAWVWYVTVSPDGQYVLSGSLDDLAKVWRISDGTEVSTLAGHTDGVRAVVTSPDGRYVFTGSDDRTIRIWEVNPPMAPAAGPTYVEGTITTTTWTKANGPYRVTGTITVPSGNTLTVEPGVDVLFDADVQFMVQGALHAVGAPNDSIRFVKGTAPEWGGMRISGGDSSTIAYARISGGNARGDTWQDQSGGGIFLSGTGTLGLAHTVISGNSASESGGGVLAHENATLTMTNCTISGNSAYYGGGVSNNATMTMTNCTISGNSASGTGGGIFLSGTGTLGLAHTVISGNSAVNGGGVLNNATLTMTNCTISGNSGSGYGGGVLNHDATLTMANSILWGNTAPNAAQIYLSSGTVTVRYGDVQGGIPSGVTDGGGNINADPKFVNAAAGDYHLQATSPCINTGDPSSPVDPDGTRADMGAFYFPHAPPGTQVSGTITTRTWAKANQPYRVTGAITVPSGNTLTIEPGVDVLFDADVQFIVNGVLHAVGTPQDSIRFIKGTASDWRGIRISGGDSSTIAYARISGGNARGGWPDNAGGGIFLFMPKLGLAHTVISGNSASESGGGVLNHTGTLTMTNCTISGNSAPNGGGVYNVFGTLTMTNCTISGNSASASYVGGGGVFNDTATLTMTNCTISGNSASSGSGGGVNNFNTATLTMANSILWGNTASNGPQIWRSFGTVTVRYSDVQAGIPIAVTDAGGNINADPLFVNAAAGDYHLQATSPCINTGDPSSPLDPDGTRADMGAFYYHQQASGTEVSGYITTTTWTRANSPYHVAGQCTVLVANTLTIEPGVDVLFDVDAPFVVQGSLQAIGTETDSIRFIKGTASEWGGIRISGGDSSTIHFARISEGSAEGSVPNNMGGGIYISDTNTRVGMNHTVVSGDSATFGGGVFVDNFAVATLTTCTIRGNRATSGGGVYGANSAGATLYECAVTGNTAAGNGGGLQGALSTTLVLTGCLVADNTAVYKGGSIRSMSGASVVLSNCTISGNSAASGGGVSIFDNGTATLRNAIVWENTPAQQIYVETGSVAATYSDIQGGYGAPADSNINADPLFSTHPDSAYHLTGASPCIDAGDPASPKDPDSTRADMGALYFRQPGPAPFIVSVRDVPNDQGGRVIVRWTASSLDNNTDGLPTYSVWYALPAGATKPADGRRYRVAKVASVEYIWGWLADCPAIRQSSYWYAAPTLYDSMSITDALHNFMVIAHTGDPNVFHMSNVVGGRSLDNLAPAAPKIAGSRAAGKITISWSPNGEADLKHYVLYRSGTPGIDPTALAPFATTTDTLFVDNTPLPGTAYYVVRAQDVHENFSLKSNEVAIVPTDVARGRAPMAFALAQNVPNPFNPWTTISFSLPEAGNVRVAIYDASGRLVCTLVHGAVEAGTHEVVWDGRDSAGRNLASGVYLYGLTSGQGSIVRKMVLVR